MREVIPLRRSLDRSEGFALKSSWPASSGTTALAVLTGFTGIASGLLFVLSLLLLVPEQASAGDFCGADCVLSEDFDDATSGDGDSVGSLPVNWVNISRENINDGCFGEPCGDWWVNDRQGNGGGFPDVQVDFDHTDGLGNYLYVASDGNDNATVSVLTPTFTLDAANEPYATFYVHSEYTGSVASRANELHVDIMNAAGNSEVA